MTKIDEILGDGAITCKKCVWFDSETGVCFGNIHCDVEEVRPVIATHDISLFKGHTTYAVYAKMNSCSKCANFMDENGRDVKDFLIDHKLEALLKILEEQRKQ